jgi:hypothetical protein
MQQNDELGEIFLRIARDGELEAMRGFISDHPTFDINYRGNI